ncbi:MAG: TolC family protein [Kofleriaceae bacterium]
MIRLLARADRDRATGGEVGFGGTTLDRGALVAAVLARNPDLDVARETWRASVAAYPTAIAFEDPMASYVVAPFTIGSSVRFGQTIELRQKLPWPDKRASAGQAALAEAEAARADLATLQLDLAGAAVDAFDDDYVAVRALDVNQHHRELLERIEKAVLAQYTAGHGSAQDPLEIRAELISLDRDRLMLETQHRAAVATLNRLLHRPAAATLPPPPPTLEIEAARPAPPSRTVDGAPHPKLQAAQARIRARHADVEHADRAFYPDLEVMASYDAFWDAWQQRVMVGVGINLPIQRDGRRAALAMARAREASATAALSSAVDMVDEDRDRARQELDEAMQARDLYEHQLLPVARARVDAALAGFTAGQSSFTTVVMAERALRGAELQLEQARADLDRRAAARDRAEGRIPGGTR